MAPKNANRAFFGDFATTVEPIFNGIVYKRGSEMIHSTEIPEVKIITPKYFEDDRGYFSETYSLTTLSEYGIDITFVQDCHSYSSKKGTLRGLHFQVNPRAQAKLLRCLRGKILDVAVDLRVASPTYKKWVSVELSAENRQQVFIPAGFAHGFLTLTDDCEVLYKVSDFYCPQSDRAVAWNDPDIAVTWWIESPILSAKDFNAPLLKNTDINF